MNKSALLLTVIFIFVSILLPVQMITAHAQIKDSFEYTVNAGGVSVTITNYTGRDGNITIPAVLNGFSVTAISGFQYNNAIKNVVIEEGIKKIAESAMVACDNLESVTIPSSITSVGIAPFTYCPRLSSIQVAVDNAYFCSADGVLLSKAQSQLYRYPPAKSGNYTIPGSVTALSPYAFEGCKNFTGMYIPPSIRTLNSNTFEDCDNLLEIDVDGSNAYFSSQDGVLFNKNKTKLIKCPAAQNGAYAVPGTVTEIESNAFGKCNRLTRITLPIGLAKLNQGCFYMCSGITAIDIPGAITEIPMWAFTGCSSLQSIHLPDGLTKIHDVAFAACESLTGISIPDTVTTLGNGAFQDCSKLANISFPDGVTNMGPCVLRGTAISAFAIPGGINHIGFSAFEDCISLKTISIPESVKTIGSAAFAGCSKLDNVSLPSSVESIDWGAFEGCANLKSIVLPSRITEIEQETFWCCSSLKSISIPEGVTRIGSRAFGGCGKLENIHFPASLAAIEDYAFFSCDSLKYAVFQGSAPAVGERVFQETRSGFTVFYLNGSTGFTNPWHGYPTQSYVPENLTAAAQYVIDRTRGYIKGIHTNTSVDELKSNLVNSAANVRVFTASNAEYSGSHIATGMLVKLVSGGNTKDQLKSVVSGDNNGDGQISISDYVYVRLHILGLKRLVGEYKEASDINGDSKIDVVDYTSIRLHILRLKTIS